MSYDTRIVQPPRRRSRRVRVPKPAGARGRGANRRGSRRANQEGRRRTENDRRHRAKVPRLFLHR